jgi:hypothetical protein
MRRQLAAALDSFYVNRTERCVVDGRNVGTLSMRSRVLSSAICRSNAVARPLRCVTSVDRRLRISIAQFDVPVRKLLFEPQACTQCFHKHAVFGCCDSVDFNDVAFTNRVISEFGLHKSLLSFAPTTDPFQHELATISNCMENLGKFSM